MNALTFVLIATVVVLDDVAFVLILLSYTSFGAFSRSATY